MKKLILLGLLFAFPILLCGCTEQMTAVPGDIVLYSGNQLVVFFGSNSWSYTKLGHINLPANELKELLVGNSAVIELKYE